MSLYKYCQKLRSGIRESIRNPPSTRSGVQVFICGVRLVVGVKVGVLTPEDALTADRLRCSPSFGSPALCVVAALVLNERAEPGTDTRRRIDRTPGNRRHPFPDVPRKVRESQILGSIIHYIFRAIQDCGDVQHEILLKLLFYTAVRVSELVLSNAKLNATQSVLFATEAKSIMIARVRSLPTTKRSNLRDLTRSH